MLSKTAKALGRTEEVQHCIIYSSSHSIKLVYLHMWEMAASSLSGDTGTDKVNEKILSILHLGVKLTYQIPSFSIVVVDFRKVKIQMLEESSSVLLCDGFIQAD